MLEAAIRTEEKILQKSEQVLTSLQARRLHQASACAEARRALHEFRVGRRARINGLDSVLALTRDQMPMAADSYEEGGAAGVRSTHVK